MEGVVAIYRREVRERAERLIAILMRREYFYGDWYDMTGEWDMLLEAIKDSPSLAKTAPAEIKSAYRLARSEAELHGEGRWLATCPWPTLEALRRAVRARDRKYRAIEQKVGWDFLSLLRAPWKSKGNDGR